MYILRWSTGLAGSLVAAALSVAPVSAAVVGFNGSFDFSEEDFTVTIPGGAASYTFGNGGPGGFFGTDVPTVSTTGTATVASLGPPFNPEPEPTTYFTDDSRAPFIDGSLLALFVGYDDPALIENAVVDSYLALRFELEDGLHYGYARIAGTTLTEFAYQDIAGVGIQAGADPDMGFPVNDVPAPGAIALLGLGVMGLASRRRKAKA